MRSKGTGRHRPKTSPTTMKSTMKSKTKTVTGRGNDVSNKILDGTKKTTNTIDVILADWIKCRCSRLVCCVGVFWVGGGLNWGRVFKFQNWPWGWYWD